MNLEATRLTEAQRCETCVVVLEDVDEVLETMRITKEPPIDDKIQPIEAFVDSEKCY